MPLLNRKVTFARSSVSSKHRYFRVAEMQMELLLGVRTWVQKVS